MNSPSQPSRALLSASFSPESIRIPSHVISQKRILITGAGGSIGSALARALTAHHPAQILLLDASEQALYQIDRELAAPHKSILINICDAPALDEVFAQHRPQLVFHAAAFKHVPLMELHPFAAIQNNSLGTFALTQTAVAHRAEQLILVSTDKAADPASIMGASKRIAELTALALHTSTTKIKAVRLGNVYASQGSAVPLFQQQIAQGEPVTVTHPNATRYFLTMDQAAALLLSSLSEEFPNSILVPDLQKPIRIHEIAEFLIHQSGSTSQIVYTGLRPGEKLHERLLSASESFCDSTPAPLRAIQSQSISPAAAIHVIELLQKAIRERNLDSLLRAITGVIPAYKPSAALLTEHTEHVTA
ncbi:MAG TPA: polysaccharide biosynthesis protein [Silvibacterium sp.]|nr:polysaccharide biosynthesis protein [Silvibacterium sp.]